MRRLLLVLTAISGVLTGAVIYERLFVEKTFGPSAVLGILAVGSLFLSLLATYLLSRTRYREMVAKLWLAAVSVVVSYFALDLAAGFLLIQPLSPPLVPDPYRHHKLVPNSYARLEQRDFSYIQRVNNFGLRGRDISVEKPAGSYRILMLGDSFTMGKGVEDDETFSVVLEKALNQDAAACGGRTIEILNGGVDSYAPVLSLIQLKRDLTPLQPDLVVLNLDVSDLVQETAYREQGVAGPDGEIVAVPQEEERTSLTERVRKWSERRLFLTRALLFYINELFDYKGVGVRNVVTQADREVAAHTLEQDPKPRDRQWQEIFESIVRIRNYSNGRHAEFLLAVYPWGHQVNDSEWLPGRYRFMSEDAVVSDRSLHTIRELAARHGIQLVDLFPVFRAYRGQDPLYFRFDNHWTPAGHRVVAAGFKAHLERSHFTSWCRSTRNEAND